MHNKITCHLVLLLALALSATAPSAATRQSAASDDTVRHQQWINAMKTAERGPFARLRWFCNDGTVHPPKPYPCEKRGGGYQHGEWNKQTRTLRDRGYYIATLLAGVDPQALIADDNFIDRYDQMLIEKYLVAVDDGWILRRALFYRGAIQEEDEREGARNLLLALVKTPQWTTLRYPALRIGARLLPHGESTASIQKVRQISAALSEQDPGFKSLRSKIHGAPDGSDAQRVRDYAANIKDAALRAKYAALAQEIDDIYQAVPLPELLDETAAIFTKGPWLQKILTDAARALRQDDAAGNRYRATAGLLAELRRTFAKIRSASARLRILDLSLRIEAENFRASTELRQRLSQATRHERVAWLRSGIAAAYGTGVINGRGYRELQATLKNMAGSRIALSDYLHDLGYLGRVPGWGTQGLRFQFYESMLKLSAIEPMALLFIQDQLRGSPLLFYSRVLDSLLRDANQLAGVKHKLFGQTIGVGFRALNPGLARGTLHARPDLARHADFERSGIYLLPETISELPPVAGIMTAGEGNPLSHVQLLARNLGIPNVGVNEELISTLRQYDGKNVVLAVSPAGLVELAEDGPHWGAIFGESQQADAGVVIRPDLKKLDLSVKDFLNLDTLRADDSGRTVGPKAAKLGELRHRFPEAVAPGLAIPFGVFREVVLDRPYRNSKQTVFEWMVTNYRRIEKLPAGSAKRTKEAERLRAEIHELISGSRLDDNFQQRLRAAMQKTFGPLDTLGVFIRSDTNVEDLPGFTGAGLNLTLPNVVGFDNVIDGITRVWASPFTARAFAWRQSLMENPEHVYPAILLLKSVSNDKSGVMVTQDIDSGNRNILSIAVNEGVGGAVDGQSAESLRIDTRDGSVQVLAMATAPWRRNPAAAGGVEKLPVSGSEILLQPDEIRQLIRFAKELPQRFPAITDDKGKPAPADIEFGFRNGKLNLFQIRPFLESREARGSSYLRQMDEALQANMDRTVTMDEVPG